MTNIDFESWADYLGDPPLAMALVDRVADGATIVKLKGKFYRVHRGPDEPSAKYYLGPKDHQCRTALESRPTCVSFVPE